MEKQQKYLTQKGEKKYIGKTAKLYLQEHLIPQSQDMQLSIQLVFDYGNLYPSMNLISVHLTVENITKHWRVDRELSILQVYCTQMIQLNKENN